MSIRIMNYVWTLGSMTQAEKLVLLCLADNASNDGVCWPSINDIADRSLTEPRSVFRIISSLQKKGHILRQSRNGKSTVYHVVTPDIKSSHNHSNKSSPTPDLMSPPTPDIRSDDIKTPLTLSTLTPDIKSPTPDLMSPPRYIDPARPSLPSIEPSRTVNTRDAQEDFFEENKNGDSENPQPIFSVKDFYEFWKVYPSKVGKEAALKKFKLLVKSGNKPEMLIEAAVRYAKSDKVQKGFVCNPATWLNEGRYQDEYPAAVAAIPEDIDLQKARMLANSRAYLAKAVMEENRNKIAWWQSQFTEEKKAWLENYELKNGVVSPSIETGRGYEA